MLSWVSGVSIGVDLTEDAEDLDDVDSSSNGSASSRRRSRPRMRRMTRLRMAISLGFSFDAGSELVLVTEIDGGPGQVKYPQQGPECTWIERWTHLGEVAMVGTPERECCVGRQTLIVPWMMEAEGLLKWTAYLRIHHKLGQSPNLSPPSVASQDVANHDAHDCHPEDGCRQSP